MLVVDFQKLQAVIDHMATFAQEIAETLDDVDHTMAALRSTWHGDGSESQAQAQAQWDQGADQMKSALDQFKKIAEGAHKNYSDAVTKNGQMWG